MIIILGILFVMAACILKIYGIYKQFVNQRRNRETRISRLERKLTEQINATQVATKELEGTYGELQQMQLDWERELKHETGSQLEPQNSQEAAISDKVKEYKKLNFQVYKEYKIIQTQLSNWKKHNIDLRKWFEDTIESIKHNNANKVTDLKKTYTILLETNNKLVKENNDVTTKLTLKMYNFEQTLNAIHQHEDGFLAEQEKFKNYLEGFFSNVEAYTKTMKRDTENATTLRSILKSEENINTSCGNTKEKSKEKFIENFKYKRFEIGGKELAED